MTAALGRFLFVGFFFFLPFFFFQNSSNDLAKNLTVVPAHPEPGV